MRRSLLYRVRVRVREGISRSAEEIVTELWRTVFRRPDTMESEHSEGKAERARLR